MGGAPARRRDLELLVSIKAVDPNGSVVGSCFGNILELGCDSLVLESNREQRPGAALSLRVAFPGRRTGPRPIVTLHGVVRRVRDEQRLHYDVAIDAMDSETRRAVAEYLDRSG